MQYTDDEIDLFELHTGNKINKSPLSRDAIDTIKSNIINGYHGNAVLKLELLEGGKILLVQYSNKDVDLFNVEQKIVNFFHEERQGIKINRNPIAANANKTISSAVIGGGQLFLLYTGGDIEMFDLFTGQKTNAAQGKGFTLRNTILVIRANDGSLTMFHIPTGQQISQDNKDVRLFQFQNGQPIFYILYKDNTIDVFDTNTGNKINASQIHIPQGKEIRAFVAQQGEKITPVIYKDESIDIFDLESGNKLNQKDMKLSPICKRKNISDLVLASPKRFKIKYEPTKLSDLSLLLGKKVIAGIKKKLQLEDNESVIISERFNLDNGERKLGFQKSED